MGRLIAAFTLKPMRNFLAAARYDASQTGLARMSFGLENTLSAAAWRKSCHRAIDLTDYGEVPHGLALACLVFSAQSAQVL